MPHPCPRQCGKCHLCNLYQTSPRHRAYWDGLPPPPAGPGAVPAPAPPAAPARDPRPPCRHLGGPTGEEAPCRSCGAARAAAAVFACAVHGECTTDRLAARLVGEVQHKLPCCRGCPEYQAP